MPRQRGRVLARQLLKSIGFAPITALLGARQAGKTTLLKQYVKSYFTFDDPKLAEKVEQGRESFLDSAAKPAFFDEVQKYEPIFDLLKLAVDQQRRPGRFLITGSVRFSQKKGVRESLTGRVQLWALLPLTVSEAYEKPFQDWLEKVRANTTLDEVRKLLADKAWCTPANALHYLKTGGLPGMCFVRDEAQRTLLQESYFDTLLGRDIHMIRNSSLRMEQHLRILTDLAKAFPNPVSLSQLARTARISVPTVKSTLAAYEGLFLIQKHGLTYYFNDPGLLRYLYDYLEKPEQWLAQWLFQELRAQVEYRKGLQLVLDEYRTRGGAHVPFVLRSRKRGFPTLAICFEPADYLSEKTIKSLYSFQRSEPASLAICAYLGHKPYLHKNRILALPWTAMA